MHNFLGIILALTALLCWGFGDFFIQKSTRIIGSYKALFFIGITGLVLLFPFIASEIFALNVMNWILLILLGAIVIFAALFDFEALRQGKISIVEPLLGIELPITVGLSVILAQEKLFTAQWILIAIIFIGIIMAITIHHAHLHYHKRLFEKGAILAGIGAIGMALTNFLVGISSQQISPLMTIWFTHTCAAIVMFIILIGKKEIKNIFYDFKKQPALFGAMSAIDNMAWVAFGYATTLIPISIAATISESYIVLASALGIYINKEKLKTHQIIGIILAIGGVLLLSAITSK
ncbi:EamA family transporter [Candidatus Falkowbacteria bacterium]|nr:EamA family transporter [Candidatus Falkowbacteria bacterium]